MDVTAGRLYVGKNAEMVLKRSFLAFIVILFFGDIAIYLSLAVSAYLEPQYWIGVLVVLAGILAWFSPQTRWQAFRTPVFFWCVLFLALTLIFFIAVPTSHIEQLKERIRDVVLLTAFLAVFMMLQDELRFLRKLVLVAVILGVIINLVSFVHNGVLTLSHISWAYRPAGFYVNSNESAVALILGMLLSISIVPVRWRSLYIILDLAGVAVTFSREGVLGWIIVAFCLCATGILNWKSLALYTMAFILCAGAAVLVLIKTQVIAGHTLAFYHIWLDRFLWFLGDNGIGGSNEFRVKLLKAGWALFVAHPWIGNGIGSTYHWSLPASTHNMYLLYMDDYGVIGLLLYPLLMWCMLYKAAGQTRKLAWSMAIFLLFWGLFDHNIVQNYYSLFAIALTAAISSVSADTMLRHKGSVTAESGAG